MAYNKTTWIDDVTPLDAEHLNNIEDGIEKMYKATVNGKTLSDNPSLTAADVGALPDSTKIPIVDKKFSASSENAQSGKAVAEALSGYVAAEVGKGLSSNDFTNEDKEKLYSALQNENIDKTYTPTSENAQSGKAVAEAINNNTATNLKNGSSVGSIRSIGSTKEDSSYKIGRYTMAEGSNTQTGAKAFTILGVNKTNKTYTLDSTEGLTVGDIYSAHVLYTTGASSQAENYGKITAINGNIVTVDKLWCEGDFATSDSYISDGYDGEKNTFRIISKPNIGTRVIADVSHAEGVSTKALSKGSHSEGKGTIAYGSWSHAEGNNTKAGYSSHAEGSNTTSSGFNSHAEGEKTTSSGFNTHAEGVRTVSSGFASHAEGSDTKASDTGSHSEGFKTIASGFASHAEGKNTESSGENSHAEGSNTVAVGSNSHAEGNGTKASASYSHAEGFYTKASDSNSHAEGNSTTASGYASHAEGNNTKASGSNSHAEGNATVASGYVSHAEGNNTKASGSYQHVQGKHNIADTANTYADIIGNGSSDTERSNAATVDWDGNAWYAGDVYIGSTSGTNKDEGSKKLATEKVVLEAVTTEQKRADNTFANALKGSKSGSAILIDDVSPVEHTMTVKVSSDTVTDLTAVTVSRCGKNLIPFPYRDLKLGTSTYNGIDFTVYEDGSILINGTATISTSKYLYNNVTDLLGLKSGITISGSKNASDNTQQANVYFICNYYDSTGSMKQGLVVSTISSGTKTIPDDWKGLGIYVNIPKGKTLNNLLIKPQLEIGTTSTEYEPYITPTDYTPTADGTVNGVTSLYPNTTLTTDTDGVLIDCEYNRDINKAFAELQQAIISLGGNV